MCFLYYCAGWVTRKRGERFFFFFFSFFFTRYWGHRKWMEVFHRETLEFLRSFSFEIFCRNDKVFHYLFTRNQKILRWFLTIIHNIYNCDDASMHGFYEFYKQKFELVRLVDIIDHHFLWHSCFNDSPCATCVRVGSRNERSYLWSISREEIFDSLKQTRARTILFEICKDVCWGIASFRV